MDDFVMNLQLFGEDDGFSDDFTPETPVEPAEPQAEIEQPTEEPTETPTEEPKQEPTPKVKLKYNHEEKEYSLDDVVPLAQKGLNYDKLQEKLNAIQNDPRMAHADRIQQLADLYGVTVDEMLETSYNRYYESEAEKQGLTPEQIRKDHELTQKERMIQQKEQAQSKAEADRAMYSNFLRVFPNVKPEEIKAETWQLVNQGMDLTAAYVAQRNHELESKLKVMEQNLQNVKKAPVAGITTHGGGETAHKDAFLEGFEED
jgi:hypothetical protein